MSAALRSIHVLQQPDHAAVLLEPTRLRLMRELAEPTSAAELSRKTGEPRQRINYHLKELERVGLVRLVEERKKGNCVERLVQATASAYIVSPSVLGALGGEPAKVQDRFSSAFLIAVAAETVREVARLREKADSAGKKLATLSVQTTVRVPSAERLTAMSAELTESIARIAAKYHDDSASAGRVFKVNLASYPAITRDLDQPHASDPDQAPQPLSPEPSPPPAAPPAAQPSPRRPSDFLKRP